MIVRLGGQLEEVVTKVMELGTATTIYRLLQPRHCCHHEDSKTSIPCGAYLHHLVIGDDLVSIFDGCIKCCHAGHSQVVRSLEILVTIHGGAALQSQSQ